MRTMGAISKRAYKGTVDVICRVSPETGKLMETISGSDGNMIFRDPDTGKVYKTVGSVANQSKQDQILFPYSA